MDNRYEDAQTLGGGCRSEANCGQAVDPRLNKQYNVASERYTSAAQPGDYAKAGCAAEPGMLRDLQRRHRQLTERRDALNEQLMGLDWLVKLFVG